MKILERYYAWITVFFLGVAAWVWAAANLRTAGFDLSDEADLYLSTASLRLSPAADWGPLYWAWYVLLNQFKSDMYGVYYLSGALLTVLCAVSLFFFLRTWKANLFASTLGATLFLLMPNMILITKKPNHLAFAVIAFSLGCANLCENWNSFLFVAAIGQLLASYCRPEFLAGFVLASAGFAVNTAWELARTRQIERAGINRVLAFVFVTCGGFALFGVPYGSHSPIAFFAKNGERMQATTVEGYKLYGNAETIQQAIRNNPTEFLRHVNFYFHRMIDDTVDASLSLSYLVTTPFYFVLVIALMFGMPKKYVLPGLGQVNVRRLVAALSIGLGPTVLACLVFGGLPQYMFGIFALVLSTFALLAFSWVKDAGAPILALALAIWICVRPHSIPPGKIMPKDMYWGILESVEYLRDTPTKEAPNILNISNTGQVWSLLMPARTATGTKWCYAPNYFCPADALETEKLSFVHQVEELKANVVILSDYQRWRAMKNLPEGSYKSEFAGFIDRPGDYGFVKRDTSDRTILFIRSSIL